MGRELGEEEEFSICTSWASFRLLAPACSFGCGNVPVSSNDARSGVSCTILREPDCAVREVPFLITQRELVEKRKSEAYLTALTVLESKDKQTTGAEEGDGEVQVLCARTQWQAPPHIYYRTIGQMAVRTGDQGPNATVPEPHSAFDPTNAVFCLLHHAEKTGDRISFVRRWPVSHFAELPDACPVAACRHGRECGLPRTRCTNAHTAFLAASDALSESEHHQYILA